MVEVVILLKMIIISWKKIWNVYDCRVVTLNTKTSKRNPVRVLNKSIMCQFPVEGS